MNPNLFNIHFKIIIPSTPKFSKQPHYFGFPHQSHVCMYVFLFLPIRATFPTNLVLIRLITGMNLGEV